MKFSKPLLDGIFVKRYKRFFADVLLNGELVTAHVPNSGSMQGCKDPDSPCRITYDDNPKRKLQYTLEMIQTPTSWVGVNTQTPNKIVKEAIEEQLLPHWGEFPFFKPEAKINDKSRLDFVLSDQEILDFNKIDLRQTKQRLHFIEVKNVTLAEGSQALFPDAVTERGQKHLQDLMELIDLGFSAELVFTIQRTDTTSFRAAHEIDPQYAILLKMAQDHGVRITPLVCHISSSEISLTDQILPLEI